MPDYNLGRAHGTIRIDYDGSGADDARKDIHDVGDEADRSGEKIEKSNETASRSFRQLGQSARNTNATPEVDNNVLRNFISNLQQIQSNTRVSSSLINTFSGRLRLAVVGVSVLSPGIAGLGVSLASLAGLAGVAAGALAGVGAVAGTVGAGLTGVAAAFKASATQAKAAGGSAGASAKAQRSAARSIEDAKRSLTQAEENLRRTQEDAARAVAQALKQVIDAQRDLIGAQRDALRAQQDLNKARQQAVRDLEDLQFALTGGSLDERQAILDVKEAQEELNKVLKDPTATADDIEQATINYERQKLALEEARKANERLSEEQTVAAATGVEGSERVVSAQDSVRDATESVFRAQESLAEAQENVRQVQVDSARQIQDAIRSVIDAQRNLSEAYEDAAESADSGGGSVDKLAEALAELSPNARAFVQEVLALESSWDALRRSVQDELFAGLADEVQPLARTWFPLLGEGMRRVARGLNGIIMETVGYLKTVEAQENVSNIFNNTAAAVENLRTFVRDLLAAFLDIASVGSDFLPAMANDAANAATKFRDFVNAAQESGELRQWMQEAMDAANQLWELLKNLGSIIGTVFSSLDQNGGGALNTLVQLTDQVDEFLKSAEGQEALQSLGQVLASIGGAYGKVFMSFLEVAADILVAIAPLVIAFADAAGTYLAVALQAVAPVLQLVATVLGALGPALGPVIAGIYAANKAVDAAKFAWGALNGVMKANPFIAIASVIIALVFLIIQNWDSIVAFLKNVWEGIANLATTIWNAIGSFFAQKWQEIRDSVVNLWEGITGFLSQKWNEIKNSAVNLWNGIGEFFKNIWDTIVRGIRTSIDNIVNFFRELPGKIWDFVRSLPERFLQLGKDIVSGILRGLGNLGSALLNKLKQAVSNAWDSVLNFFGISSPSKLAAEAGENIVAGLVRGIDTSAASAVRAAASMAQAVGNEFTGASGTLATQINMAAHATGIPDQFIMNGALGSSATAATTARGGDGAVAGRTVVIEKVDVYVQGNLDPTNPVVFRQTMVRLKNELRGLDKEYS